jgi:hypothetical protein
MKKNAEKGGPMIALGYLRNEKGDIDRIRLVPFQPGSTIDRCGHRYLIMENGSQKRIA